MLAVSFIAVPKFLGQTVKFPKYESNAKPSFSKVFKIFVNLCSPSFIPSLILSLSFRIINFKCSLKFTKTIKSLLSYINTPLPTGQSSFIPAASSSLFLVFKFTPTDYNHSIFLSSIFLI